MINAGGSYSGFSTAVEILRATPTPDDAGAETADRFDWQASMATVDVLAAYHYLLSDTEASKGASVTMICEHHEDWALVVDDTTEIVSAKHREASVARLGSVRSLLECGVLHLFERWEALGRTPMCRLVTTAGLADDASKIEQLTNALRSEVEVVLDDFAPLLTNLAAQIGVLSSKDAPTQATITSFLFSLRIQHSQPRRDLMPDLAATRYAQPVADRLGRADAAQAVWVAVLALVRERMRSAGPAQVLPIVLGMSIASDPQASRSLTIGDVEVAVRVALRNVAAYAELPRRIRINRMAVKMVHGGCSDTTVERLDALRRQHQRHWRALTETPSLRDRRRRLDNLLMKIASDATEAVRTSDAEWGVRLLSEIENRLQVAADEADAQGLDADLMLGGIGELSNRCKVWFTDSFDVAAEIARLSAEATA